MKKYDVIILGAGAAGLSAARSALANSKKTLILDMGPRAARKVLVSGGGRCNFTNMAAALDRYFGANPDFVRSALATVKPSDITEWAREHGLEWVEKAPGQFFCKTGALDFVSAMLDDVSSADIVLDTTVKDLEKQDGKFIVRCDAETYQGKSVIVATGGISYPTLGVSDFGYMIAKKFGHAIVPPRPGLVGLKTNIFPSDLSGISLDVEIKIGKKSISDSMLFTHFGIGGPAAYRASLFNLEDDIYINFLPNMDVYSVITQAKKSNGRKSLKSFLSVQLPIKFAKWLCDTTDRNIADYKDKEIADFAQKINHFCIPGGTVRRNNFEHAEITFGGISTQFISSKTMESKLCPGMYFAGEVLDIAGDLGGFNLHFAFASGIVAGSNA